MLDYDKFTGYQDLSKDRAALVDAQGRMRSANLFLETHDGSKNYDPMYSLRYHDGNGLPSAYLIYMTSVDEYDAATKLVGSMRHWRKLCDSIWFMDGRSEKGFEGLTQWREDMIARDASAGKSALMKQVKKGDTSAARKIIDMAKPAAAPKVGRPGTKADKEAKAEDKKKVARARRIEQAAAARAERNDT
jgi:hypothetical protein